MRVEVIGPNRIGGARKGETVDLDPDVVNVPALVAAGHVRVLADEPKPDPAKVRPAR